MNIKTISCLATAGALMFVASASQAAPITAFDFTVTQAFVVTKDNKPIFGPSSTGGKKGTKNVTSTSISWGAGGSVPINSYLNLNDDESKARYARSGLEIGNTPATGSVLTDAPSPELTGTFTHYNNVISGDFASLKSAQLILTSAFSAPGTGVPVKTFSSIFDIHFLETKNTASTTTGSATTGSAADADADIFVISYSQSTNTFTYDGYEYTFTYDIDFTNSIGALSASACAAAGVSAASTCVGFLTPEASLTQVQWALSVSSKYVGPPSPPIPEPGILALLGIGLAGMALRRRRA